MKGTANFADLHEDSPIKQIAYSCSQLVKQIINNIHHQNQFYFLLKYLFNSLTLLFFNFTLNFKILEFILHFPEPSIGKVLEP